LKDSFQRSGFKRLGAPKGFIVNDAAASPCLGAIYLVKYNLKFSVA